MTDIEILQTVAVALKISFKKVTIDEMRETNHKKVGTYCINEKGNVIGLTIRADLKQIPKQVSRLLDLTYLDLSNNRISNISVLKELINVERLFLGNNRISDISLLGNLSKISELSLFNNAIENIASLSKLSNLLSLQLEANRIDDVSPLQGLKEVVDLNLDSNLIVDISPLAELTKLKSLSLSENSISEITYLQKLAQLRQLSLSLNDIVDISSLSNLTNLEELYLAGNCIADISALIGAKKLISLALSNNIISDIKSLRYLENLEFLYLDGNSINDISALRKLRKLVGLDLNNNLIKKLPEWIVDFDMYINYEKESYAEDLNLYGNLLENPPVEIILQGKDAIRAWFRGGVKVPVNEVKVLLVGHGDVGKTSLVKCLTGAQADPNEIATDHIRITSHNISYNDKNVKLNYWDFGGQEVMHATHQFFLSKRSIYILVLDGRRDEDAEYWLKHIESFGGSSPVLVAMNKIDSNPAYDLDRRFLQQKFPFIIGFYKTVCLGDIKGIAELQNGLRTAIDTVGILSFQWPQAWLVVKKQLENSTDNYISQLGYGKLCEVNDIKDNDTKEILAEFLNDIGVVVHFKDLQLNDLHILQPRWASRAAYKIINSKLVANSHGLFKEDWLSNILMKSNKDDFEYEESTYSFIIELMKKFELCYSIDGSKDFLVPELMDIQQPELPKHKGTVLSFFFKYEDLLPRSIMPRFIVRLHEYIKDELRWRTGVVLTLHGFDSTAIVVSDVKERRINITVSGRHRREHFAMIRSTFYNLHKVFEKLKVTEWIPLPDVEDFALEYDELTGYEESGMLDYFVGKLKKVYEVKGLLNGIEPESVRNEDFTWDAFLCHSSKDKAKVKRIASIFELRGISCWLDDEQIEPGDNIIDKITEGLQKSRNIVPFLSEQQLKSGWSKIEYQSILNAIIPGLSKQKVAPLILDEIPFEQMPLLLRNFRAERHYIPEEFDRMLEFLSRKKRG